jgi:hypothetical protein
MKFKIGDKVRLKRSVARHKIEGVTSYPDATIIAFLEDIDGGVALDRRIGCVRFWNVEDLEPVSEATPQESA